MDYIGQFLKRNWLGKAKVYVFNPKKMKHLLVRLTFYLSRKGLSDVKYNLALMRDYLQDVANGEYKDYDIKKLTLIVAAVVYVVTPFDFFPDLIPSGLIDDFSIITWAMKESVSELALYKEKKGWCKKTA